MEGALEMLGLSRGNKDSVKVYAFLHIHLAIYLSPTLEIWGWVDHPDLAHKEYEDRKNEQRTTYSNR